MHRLMQAGRVKKGKTPSKNKRSGEKRAIALNEEERIFAEFEDMVAEEEAQWEPEPADEMEEEAEQALADEMDPKAFTAQKKVRELAGGCGEGGAGGDRACAG